MFRVLRFHETTTLADVSRAIQRTLARRIALVFPSGMRARWADAGWMEAIATLCTEAGKAATIVGGDELLRAWAVASGLPAAVSVEDWRAMRAGAEQSWRISRRRALPVRLTLVPSQPVADTHDDDDADLLTYEAEPPEFVRELLSLHGRDVAQGSVAIGTPGQPRRPFVVVPRPSTIAYDLDTSDAVRAKWEHDEEHLTATIRATSGLAPDPQAERIATKRWRVDGASE